MLFGSFCHVSFYIEAGHFNSAICSDRDDLFEMAGEFTGTIVGNFDAALFTWFYRCLCILRHGTSATCHRLIDNQGLLAHIRVGEGAGHYGMLGSLMLMVSSELKETFIGNVGES